MADALERIRKLPPDEQEDAIEECADAIVANGATLEELEELQDLVDDLNELVRQRKRPH